LGLTGFGFAFGKHLPPKAFVRGQPASRFLLDGGATDGINGGRLFAPPLIARLGEVCAGRGYGGCALREWKYWRGCCAFCNNHDSAGTNGPQPF